MRPVYIEDPLGRLPGYSNEFCIYTPSKINKNRVIYPLSTNRTCREYFCSDYRVLINNNTTKDMVHKGNTNVLVAEMPANPERMINIHRFVLSGIHIARLFEEYVGWKKTDYTKCIPTKEYSTRLKDKNVYYIRGSVRWNRGPHLLSLYLLLIRSGHILDARGITSLNQLKKELKSLIDNRVPTYNGQAVTDRKRLYTNFNKYIRVMLNYKRLYHKLGNSDKIHTNFFERRIGLEEGIDNLIDLRSRCDTMNKRIAEILNNTKNFRLKETNK